MSDASTIAPSPARAVNPATGELVELDAPSERLGGAIEEAEQLELRLRAYRHLVGEELLRRMDRAASWTLQAGELTIKGESPERVDYDPERLAAALAALAAGGRISAEAAAAAVKRKTELVAQRRGISALLKRGGEIEQLIDSCQRPVLRPRRVTVRRR